MNHGKVYHRHHPRYVFGPLGVFEVGDEVMLGDMLLIVCSIDPDGAAIGYSKAYLDEEAARIAQPDFEYTWEDKANEFKNVRTCYPAEYLTERQREQMRNIWKANQLWWESIGQHGTDD